MELSGRFEQTAADEGILGVRELKQEKMDEEQPEEEHNTTTVSSM